MAVKIGRPDKLTLIFGILLTLILIISILSYALDPAKQIRRKFHFYHEETMEISGELRNVPFFIEREKNISAYIKELLLGPETLRLLDIVPPGTKLNQVRLLEKRLYIDFSGELVFNLENHPLKLVQIKDLLVDNLIRNFPFIEEVLITVNGLEPKYEIEE